MRSRHRHASGGSTTARDWAGFSAATDGREPRALFTRALAARNGAPGQAIDVGFRDGTETAALLAAGRDVVAIDPEPAAADHLLGRLDPSSRARLEVLTVPLEAVDLAEAEQGGAAFSGPKPPHVFSPIARAPDHG